MTKRAAPISFVLSSLIIFFFSTGSDAKTGIINTRHNLSVTGPGELKALTETRICIFCHTPHNAAPRTPLWNKALEPVNYIAYSSSTLASRPGQPSGPSRLCLSCHDGTVALGAVLQPREGLAMTGEITPARSSYLGTYLADDHPVSFSYYDALPNPELSPSPPLDLLLYGNGIVHCSTCHDPHDNTYGKFLVVDNRYSALCTKCHFMDGWAATSHRTSPNTWTGGMPNPWPKTPWLTVAENGCENCHTQHSAGGPERLLYYLEEEKNCLSCHNGNVAFKNIQAEMQQFSRHPVDMTTIGVTPNYHRPNEPASLTSRHVECVDCHNPHASNARAASPPYVSGRLDKVDGVDINGVGTSPAVYEYEVCFRCHADYSPQFLVTPSWSIIPRVINQSNTRLDFSRDNPSYHPVAGIGKNPGVPSIPSTLEPTMTATTIISCTSCHDGSNSSAIGGSGPRGPHGSSYAPILRERYETADNTFESYQNYALCYRCHNRVSILNDESFRKNAVSGRGGHSGHLAAGAPCSVCHDPHGITDDGLSGSHTHLINFDTRIVLPVSGFANPFFTDRGTFSGSCTLVCHGQTHNNTAYP